MRRRAHATILLLGASGAWRATAAPQRPHLARRASGSLRTRQARPLLESRRLGEKSARQREALGDRTQTMLEELALQVRLRFDPVELQVQARAIVRDARMPRVVGAAEDQHASELGCDLERTVVDVPTAKHPKRPRCPPPSAVQIEQNADDLLPRVGMDVPVTIAFSTAVPAHREHGWMLVQVDSELALDDAPEGFADQLGEQRREPRTVTHARQREAAGGTD